MRIGTLTALFTLVVLGVGVYGATIMKAYNSMDFGSSEDLLGIRCLGATWDWPDNGDKPWVYAVNTRENKDLWIKVEDVDLDGNWDVVWLADGPMPGSSAQAIVYERLLTGEFRGPPYFNIGGSQSQYKEGRTPIEQVWIQHTDIDADGDEELHLFVDERDVYLGCADDIRTFTIDLDNDGDIDLILSCLRNT